MAVTDLMHAGSMTLFQKPTPLSECFRFAELPGELRDDIYRRYFGSWDAVIEYDRKCGLFKIGGIPAYSLMLANRATHSESNHFIAEAFSGRLILRDVKIRRDNGFGFASSLDVMASLCPKWMLDRTHTLTIDQGTTKMLTMLPWYKLESLREIGLEGSGWPVAHCYPCGLSTTAKEAQENHIFEGRYDTWCVHGYKTWSLIPKQVADGHVRVMTIRQGMVKGVFLKVRMEHKSDRVEVLDRSINNVVQLKDGHKAVQNPNHEVGVFCRPM